MFIIQSSKLMSLLFLLMSGLSACSPPRPAPEVVAYQEFVSALSYGDTEGVWAMLSKETREQLSHRLQLQPQEGGPPQDFMIELDWSFESPFAGTAQVVTDPSLQPENDERWIQTNYASHSLLIPVTLEQGEWRIHLLGSRPTPQR